MSHGLAPRAAEGDDLYAARGALVTGHPDGRVTFERDALVVWNARGVILHAGRAAASHAEIPVVAGGRDALLLAGFWDPHVHLPQLAIAGRYHEPLLEWLQRRTFPEERRHGSELVARGAATAFFDALAAAGTVGAGVFAAPFPISARVALEEASRRGVPVRCGPSLMDMGEPADLLHPTEVWIAELAALVDAHPRATAVVPRFALSCTRELLAACGQLARRHRARVLGHISETPAEVEAVRRVCGTSSYAEVYERAGLLGPRTILAHGVHLEDAELERLAFSQTWIAHAPTSNEALGSGTMPLSRLRAAGVRWCLSSDVGAGPDLCLLDVIAAHLRVHAGRAATSAVEAFWHATYAGADALGFSDERGALVAGRRADFVVVERVPKRLRSAESVLRALLERGDTGRWGEVISELWIDGRRRHPSSSTRR